MQRSIFEQIKVSKAMQTTSTTLVNPSEWKKIVDSYPNEFTPESIRDDLEGYRWQADDNNLIDISDWLLYWNIDGDEMLLTIDQMDTVTYLEILRKEQEEREDAYEKEAKKQKRKGKKDAGKKKIKAKVTESDNTNAAKNECEEAKNECLSKLKALEEIDKKIDEKIAQLESPQK